MVRSACQSGDTGFPVLSQEDPLKERIEVLKTAMNRSMVNLLYKNDKESVSV